MFGEIGVEQLIESFGYIAILGLMVTNGLFSFPSSQILYIVSGYLISTGSLALIPVVVLGAIGNTIGNTILYHLSKTRGLYYVTKMTLLPEVEIKKIQVVFDKRGSWFLFVGKLLPALKVFMPVVAGIAKMKASIFVPIVLVSSALWSLIFISIGYFFGAQSDLFGKYAIILFVIAFVVVGIFYRYMSTIKLESKDDSKK